MPRSLRASRLALRGSIFVLPLVALVFCCQIAHGQEAGADHEDSKSYLHPEFKGSKLVHSLRLATATKRNQHEKRNDQARAEEFFFHKDEHERVLVRLHYNTLNGEGGKLLKRTSDPVERKHRVQDFVHSLNGRVSGSTDYVVEAYLPLESLSQFETNADVSAVEPLYPPISMIGSVTSQVVSTLNLPYSNYTGAGVKVGVMSDSVNTTEGGLATSIGTGDLPPLARNTVLKDASTVKTDEGRGMAEIIYDIATGVDFLYWMPDSPSNMAAGIASMTASGAKVIVDDLRFLTEPVYQHGTIAQATANAVANGVVYVNSAGNYYDYAYESTFAATASKQSFAWSNGTTSSHYCHQFAESSTPTRMNGLNAGPSTTRYFILQWKCPTVTLGGTSCGVDLDLIVADWTTDPPTAYASMSGQNVYTDPVEVSAFAVASATNANFGLSVCLKQSAVATAANWNGSPVLMKIQWFSTDSRFGLTTTSPTVVYQAAVDSVIAVGAAYFWQTCKGDQWSTYLGCGSTYPAITDFSSKGGTTIYFSNDGTLLATPVTPSKPDVVAGQCGDTSFFGGSGIGDGTPFPNFCGTSASAPAVAAVVALMLEACPTLTPSQIRSYLVSSATDITVAPASVGFDVWAGNGLVDARLAIQSINCPSASGTASATPTNSRFPSSSGSQTPSNNPSNSRTITPTITSSSTRTKTPTLSTTPTVTSSSKASNSPNPSSSGLASNSRTPVVSGTATRSASGIAVQTPSRSRSRSRSHSRSRSRSRSRTGSRSRTRTSPSATRSKTKSRSRTRSKTRTRTRTRTRTSPSRTRSRTA